MKTRIHAALRPKGFALVATLSLMVLLAVLAVGLLSLSAVTLRSSSQGNAQAEARANARLALMVAIGELQKQLGPDQRISMTADQRIEAGGDGSVSSSAPGNRYWTGVYDSWPDTSESRPIPTFRRWLVSGNADDVAQEGFSEAAVSGTQAVELVGENTVGSDVTKHVKAPAVEVTDGGRSNGRMAWWIGDQGVKAAMATPPAAAGSDLAVVRNNLGGAPRNAIELASSGTVEPFAAIAKDDIRYSRVTSWQQAQHLVTDPVVIRPLFHDLAAFSTGLMTDIRTGGFRKDLSMKMETYDMPPELDPSKPKYDAEHVLYKVRSNMTGYDEVGINFMELWGFYHLHKELNYGASLNYTTGGSIPSNAPYLETKNSEAAIQTDEWDRFKHPITINYQTIFSFEVAPHPDEGGNNVLWLNFDPVVTLWNPLDVAVNIPKHQAWNYLYSFWMIPYDINISINGGPQRACSILQTSNWKNDANFLKLNAGVAESLTLKPGEVVKISQEGDTIVMKDRGQSVGGFQGFNGKKGFNYGGGASMPLLDRGLQRIVVSPNDMISYSATPRAGSEGSNSQRFSLTHVNLELGGRGATNHGLMSVDNRAGYLRAQVGQVRTMNDQKSLPNPLDIRGNEHPEVYPSIEGPSMTRELPASALISDKATFMVHSYFAKTEEENLSGSRMLSRFNPRAYSLNFYDFTKRERDMMPFETKVAALTSWLDAPLDETVNGQGYFGSSLASEFGSNYVVTHGVPRQPIVSLAAFQHSFANGFNMSSKPDGLRGSSASMAYPLEPQISHAIGNSLAPSVIPYDETTLNVPNYPHPLADHSYLANRELWDDWFLSGIAPRQRPAYPEAKDQKTVAREFFEDHVPLPVARYLPVDAEEGTDELLGRLFSGGVPTEDAVNEIASHLRVDGMFNVNSTSVEAWKTVLGALRDREIVTRTENGSESVKSADGRTPVVNVEAPRDIVLSDDAASDPEHWHGRRSLSDEQLGELAEAVVKEVRKRGPFLSLADFVNRRVGSDPDLAKSGAIQSALDSDEVSINERQNSGRSVSSGNAARFEFPQAEEGAMNYGAPSYVKQADILTPIAPILSARSDSFIIRAYGEVTDSQGNVLAKAWCEATVERDRNYVVSTEEPTVEAAALEQAINRDFGRQFTLVSFRWLNSREI